MAEFMLTVKGMTCEHCVMAVRRALEGLPEVEEAQINLETGHVRVTTSGQQLPSDEKLHEVIEEAGYELDQRHR